jgi:hypothetical protein
MVGLYIMLPVWITYLHDAWKFPIAASKLSPMDRCFVASRIMRGSHTSAGSDSFRFT